MPFEQNFEASEEDGPVDLLGKSILQRDNSECKGPGAEACLMCSRGSKMAGEEKSKERVVRGRGQVT